MQLKEYQKTAVDKLRIISKRLLEKPDTRICVLKAPTGSGKTIMLADWLIQLASERLTQKYCFIWISGNNLHIQSKDKLASYLKDSRYKLSFIDDIQNNMFTENEIVFVNWHSLTKQDRKTGEYTNIYMKENEKDQNLQTYINNSKHMGLEVILIVDESHYHYWSLKSQEFIQRIVKPKLTLEVSATPKLEPKAEDIANEDSGFVSVKFEDVVKEGMIKKEVIINPQIDEFHDYNAAADEVILKASLSKRALLAEEYKKHDVQVNPLVLIQLPSESADFSDLDRSKFEFVTKYLKENGITVDNGKLAIWLSGKKENTENLELPDNEVEVLIFKQAIALGWDCPRAQILVMFRDIKSHTFEVQTVGRILRMPEAKHYKQNDLDNAYVFTNLDSIFIAQDKESNILFKVYLSQRDKAYQPITLPSIYLGRTDYGDLTLKFREIFIREANKYFGILETDIFHIAKEKADKKLELYPEELTQKLIVNAVFSDIDEAHEKDIIGENVHFSVPEDDMKYRFEIFAKLASLPFAPSRSHTKIQQSFYDWFDNYLGYKDESRLIIQRIIACSEKNQKIFKEIIESAKEEFKAFKKQDLGSKNNKKDYIWDVPKCDYFGETFEIFQSNKSVMKPCYLRKDRSSPEKEFEKYVEESNSVEWWYKNGSDREIDFGIEYIDPLNDAPRVFYPDYILKFADGSIGIFDTKSGFTVNSDETLAKFKALRSYITTANTKGLNIKGSIVNSDNKGLMYVGEISSDNQKDWQRLFF